MTERDMKHFSEQGFIHDLFDFNWDKINLTANVKSAWNFFYDGFSEFLNKHTPFKR